MRVVGMDVVALVRPAFKCISLLGFAHLNSQMASSAFSWSQSSHWLSESGYPAHLTRYCSLRPRPLQRESSIFSTSNSSTPSTSSGGGRR